jgi:hypothetical protein
MRVIRFDSIRLRPKSQVRRTCSKGFSRSFGLAIFWRRRTSVATSTPSLSSRANNRAAAESYAKVAGWLVEGGSNTTLIDARRQSIALLGELSI